VLAGRVRVREFDLDDLDKTRQDRAERDIRNKHKHKTRIRKQRETG
jgi:hypothetical protein